MSRRSSEKPEETLLEEAAGELRRVRGVSDSHASPLSDDQALEAVDHAWAVVGDLGAMPELIALRRAALHNASRATKTRWRRQIAARLLPWASAAAVLVAAVIGAGAYLGREHQPQIYQTPIGERRIITLADNSKISLDQNSRVSVRYSRRFRDLKLMSGQAEFDVAKDPLRPFSVTAGGRRVVATGTLFNVDILDRQLLVSLLRGGVVVAPDGDDTPEKDIIALKPSERLVVDRSTGEAYKTQINAAEVEAWQLDKLVFDAEPLAHAVDRVNRYALRKISLLASDQGDQPISGVFNVGDTAAFAEAVAAQLPVRSEQRGGSLALIAR